MPSEYFKSLTTDAPQKGVIGTPIGNTGYGSSKYDYEVNPQDALYNLEEFRHNNQNNWDVLGNASMHFAGSAVNAALEIPAIAFGALKAPFTVIDNLTQNQKQSFFDFFIKRVKKAFYRFDSFWISGNCFNP